MDSTTTMTLPPQSSHLSSPLAGAGSTSQDLVASNSSTATRQDAPVDEVSDEDDDEWFNQPINRRPVPSQEPVSPIEDPWMNSWDQQPESGPLIIPTIIQPPSEPGQAPPSPPRSAPPAAPLSAPPPIPAGIPEIGRSLSTSGLPDPGALAQARRGSTGALDHQPHSNTDVLPPAYSPSREGSVLSRTSTASSDVSDTSLPPYEVATAASSTSPKTAPGFHPTRILQIETAGIGMIRIPILPPRSLPVPIRTVSDTGEIGPAVYNSIQASRTSGSCVLVDAQADNPVCTTIYAPGPVRPPKLRLVLNSVDKVITPREAGNLLKVKAPYDAEIISVSGDSATSRACSIRTSLGHFRWRYGNRDEKEDAKGAILIFERIRERTLPSGIKQETRKRIGQLLRGKEFRAEGSARGAAGHGGRLMLDLNEWADRKGESQMLEILAVSSCLVMLRKEMNQRRLKQAAVIATTAAIL